MKLNNIPGRLALGQLALAALALAFVGSPAAFAATQLEFSAPFQVSNDETLGYSFKPKLVRLSSGRLVSVYGDAIEIDPNHFVYDAKGDKLRPARDIFARYCDSGTVDCTDPANWSQPVNISNTAALSSISTDWDGARDDSNVRKPYFGDSDKPNIFSAGSRIVVSWVDKYCPDGDLGNATMDATAQRSVAYVARDFIEVPFSCAYAVSSANGGVTWAAAQQLSTGIRDAKQDVSRGLGSGHWAMTWQEDPSGLKLGEGGGPGDGASGANVGNGTDIWYTWAAPAWADANVDDGFGFWTMPVRLTDNSTGQPAAGNVDPVYEADGTPVDNANMDGGQAGAARANLAMVDDSARSGQRYVLAAYEETKGSDGIDEGKFIRYHNFAWNDPASSNPTGCLISDPTENARRVRFVPQKGPGPTTGMRLGVFWKQGLYDQGGPSDIMLRVGFADLTDTSVTGLSPAHMVPTVDPACETSVYEEALNLSHAATLNLSTETPTATAIEMGHSSDANPVEDARAHRAVMRGDDFYIGWSYTGDWAVATYTDLDNYNFWMRRYNAAADTWLAPANMSNLDLPALNVKEPRLVGMPGNGPKCSDPSNPVDPEDCQNKAVVLIAWGTETNVYSHLGGSEDLEIYYTRTTDKGNTYEPVQVVAGRGDNARFEAQLRPTPAGNIVHGVWAESDALTGTTTAQAARAIARVDDDDDGLFDDEDNCILAANADQVDVDSDGIGNACDADLNNDCVVNATDLGQMKSVFFTDDALADLNGDGIVNSGDLTIMSAQFFRVPGPSGVANVCD